MRLTGWIWSAAGMVVGLVPVPAVADEEAEPAPGEVTEAGVEPGAEPGVESGLAGAALAPGPLCTLVLETLELTCGAETPSRLAQQTTLVATLYPARSYVGAPTLAIRSEKGDCRSGRRKADFQVDLRYLYFYDGDHWDDEAMSFRAYGACKLKMYDGADGPEGRLGSTPYLDDLAALGGIGGRSWGRKADLVALS